MESFFAVTVDDLNHHTSDTHSDGKGVSAPRVSSSQKGDGRAGRRVLRTFLRSDRNRGREHPPFRTMVRPRGSGEFPAQDKMRVCHLAGHGTMQGPGGARAGLHNVPAFERRLAVMKAHFDHDGRVWKVRIIAIVIGPLP